jgi:hypothetical protein
MSKVTFPCYSALELIAFLFYAALSAGMAVPFFLSDRFIVVSLGFVWLIIAVLLLRKFLTTPRAVEIDPSAGTAVFLGPRWCTNLKDRVIEIRNFSTVFAEFASGSSGISYFVGLSNIRGESTTIIFRADASVARTACDFISINFGLRNLGGAPCN